MINKDKFPINDKQLNENAPRCKGGEMRGRCGDHREKFMEFYRQASVSDKLMINLRFMIDTMRSQFEQKAGQKRILFILNEQGTLTQRELTEQLGIRPGSASEILSKLENAGLIARTQNAADRRTVDVSLTEAGAALAAESAEKRGMQREDMFTCLTAEEQENLLSLFEKIHADWETRFPRSHGPHGHHGPRGPHGDFGPHGPHGKFGPHGPFGEFGPRGPHGECGHHGPRGDFGPHGPRGEFGCCRGKPHGDRPDGE